jgi:hypothetical protein
VVIVVRLAKGVRAKTAGVTTGAEIAGVLKARRRSISRS